MKKYFLKIKEFIGRYKGEQWFKYTVIIIALLIAAMSADGISRIHNIEQIDRGYQNIEGRLNALGARITRIE